MPVSAVAASAAANIEGRYDDTNFTGEVRSVSRPRNERWFTRCFRYLNHRPGFWKSVPSCRLGPELGSWFTVELVQRPGHGKFHFQRKATKIRQRGQGRPQ